MSQVIAAPACGSLPAAIGIVRISGDGCFDVLDKIFRAKCKKPTTQRIFNKMYYGELLDFQGNTLDLCLCAAFKAPSSYTGEDMAELYCHGSNAVVRAAVDAVCAFGGRFASPGEFTRRAFLNGKLDLTEAEATADLIHSTSSLAAQAAVSQLKGSVGSEIKKLRGEITALLAHFYAVCDYTDEDIEPFECENAAKKLKEAALNLQNLADGFKRGNAIKNGIPVAVLGKPNAGKSSLFNALSGEDRAIVTSEAGTTRDVIEEHIEINGAKIRLFDTAGIRDAQGEAEKMGIERSQAASRSAHATICVFDGTKELEPDDKNAASLIPQGMVKCAVINKCDLSTVKNIKQQVQELGFDEIFTLSAKTGENLSALINWLSKLIPDTSGVIITSPRQARLLQDAAQALCDAAQSAEMMQTADAFLSDAERALNFLGEITGESASSDIAAEIFSRFCVGK